MVLSDRKMRVLVACEESQEVCKAFRYFGCEAYSCDIKECSGGHPEWHIKDDVLSHLDDGWDLMIAHPPCTFITKAGACNFYINGRRHEERFAKQREAVDFFMKLYTAPIEHICIENPVPMASAALPKWSQVIYPELFGAEYTKQTCLWLKNLPPLIPMFTWIDGKCKSLCEVYKSATLRSKTPKEVAMAMANQWINLNVKECDY